MDGADVDTQELSAPSRRFDRIFRIAVALKGLDGLLEVLVGAALLFVSPGSINHIVRSLTAHELAQDPTDFLSRHLVNAASHLSTGSTIYGGIYLLAHGGAKLALVILVLRNKLWAYPWMIALLGGFIAYQSYQFAVHPTVGVAALTVFDAVVAWLTWREYRSRRKDREEREGRDGESGGQAAGQSRPRSARISPPDSAS
jgi:uncharacterized membrane protein